MKKLSYDTPLSAAIALGATSPTPAAGSRVYSTTTGCYLEFDGSRWCVPLSNRMIVVSKSAAYTFVAEDGNTTYLHPSADTTARTWTIPANSSVAYPVGTTLTFANQNAAGVLTIAITTDIMRLLPAGTTGSRTLAANGQATALKITSTEWQIAGLGLT